MREIQYHHDSGQLPPSLEKVPFLRGMEEGLMEKLMGDAVILEFYRDDSLIVEGDVTDFFCILLTGQLDIVKDGEHVTTISGAGEMIGELALVNSQARTASVVAKSHGYCLKIEPTSLQELQEPERDAFYAKLYQFAAKMLATRLEEADKKIADLEANVRELSGLDVPKEDRGGPVVYRL